MRRWVWIVLLAGWSVAGAQESEFPTPSDLPAAELAKRWVQEDSSVQAALGELAAARAAAGMLAASPNEWTVSYASQRRKYNAADSHTNEWTSQLQRTIRIPGKGVLDRKLGTLGVQIAEAELGDAIHEAARSLLNLWMDWVEATNARSLIGKQLAYAQSNLRAVEVRARIGDAARFEVNVAASDAADLQRKLADATGAVTKTRARLKLRYSDVPEAPPPLSVPEKIPATEAVWREQILAEAHPVLIAELQLQQAQRSSDRARANRIPDPTVGIFTGTEAFRDERIVGVSITVPLPGRYRSQQAAHASASVTSAAAARNRQIQMIEVEIAEAYADAVSGYEAWQLAMQSVTRTSDNAQLTQRAYTLGETDLQTLLLAQQQSLTMSQAELATRVAALRAHYRLLVDAHRIWRQSDE